MPKPLRKNFSASKVQQTDTPHLGIRAEYGEMCDWISRRDTTWPELKGVDDVLHHHATVHEGETYLAGPHIERFCKLVGSVTPDTDDDFDLVIRLRDRTGRSVLNGGEIRAIRQRQGRGE